VRGRCAVCVGGARGGGGLCGGWEKGETFSFLGKKKSSGRIDGSWRMVCFEGEFGIWIERETDICTFFFSDRRWENLQTSL